MPTVSIIEPQAIHHQKQLLRRQIRAHVKHLSPAFCQQAAQRVIKRLLTTPVFRRSHTIALYQAQAHEIELTPLIEQIWLQGKRCFLPVLHPLKPRQLWFVPFEPHTRLVANRYDILEPAATHKRCPIQCLDLVITPLVGFTRNCLRLGMGGGFYDTTFGPSKRRLSRKPQLIGLAYELQKINTLPHQPWDLHLDGVITEMTEYHPREHQ